jgi:hypothetical protein
MRKKFTFAGFSGGKGGCPSALRPWLNSAFTVNKNLTKNKEKSSCFI